MIRRPHHTPPPFAAVAAAAAVLLVAFLHASAALAQGLSYQLTPRQVAPDTWVVEGKAEHFTRANGGFILNPAFIVTDEGVVLFQTGPSRRFGEDLRKAIATVTDRPVVRVYVQNLHPDYFLGNQAFKDAPIAALPGTIDGIKAEGQAVLGNMYTMLGDWMRGTEMLVPTEAVEPGAVEIGGHRLRLIQLSGHTDADLAVFDETTGVLFAGGLVFSDRAPTTPHAEIGPWLAALDELETLPVKVLVPNHGAVRADKAAIAQTRDYLIWLRTTLADAAERGLDMPEVMATPIPERFRGMGVVEEEFVRSVAHLYPEMELAALPPLR